MAPVTQDVLRTGINSSWGYLREDNTAESFVVPERKSSNCEPSCRLTESALSLEGRHPPSRHTLEPVDEVPSNLADDVKAA
ncbi:hypothetical protein X801_01626 [Opisthorchis viverrini]|uniref:Uncharacterized protein n=1 Tax=Opisthorchis viverrini TaxID=6198 RepID=A0A1S8X6W0_OPIVI|nr:hypothetical protein X801_01626 [Opisthorchis viverrini]